MSQPTSASDVALEHYARTQQVVDSTAAMAQAAWDKVDPNDIVNSYAEQLPGLTATVAAGQHAAAAQADDYLGNVLEAQGLDTTAVTPVDPAGFAGTASDGGLLLSLLTNPALVTLGNIQTGVQVLDAMTAGRQNLDMIVRTQVADAGRLADHSSLIAHPAVDGYTRIAVGGSCSRCLILAGKFYRWSTGFARHPRCDCKHIPTRQAKAAGLIQDPADLYARMSTRERLRAGFSYADQEALRLGADLNQVVNARRGVYVAGGRRLTREGTTRRGLFGGYEILDDGTLRRRAAGEFGPGGGRYRRSLQPRLTPDQIFAEATSREDAIVMLRQNGYLSHEAPLPALPEREALLRGLGEVPTPAPTGAAAATGGTVTHIDDLPRLEHPEDMRAVAMGTNPRYGMAYEGPIELAEAAGPGGATYTQNCTRVAITYEMRRRGFAVTAGAGNVLGETIAPYVRTFRQAGRYATRVADDLSRKITSREAAAEVESWPRGARGIITVQGHTLNVERDAVTGRAVFVDAQAAKNKNPIMSRVEFERRMKARGAPIDRIGVARVDDLDLSDYGLRYVESPELRLADGQIGKTEWPSLPGSDRALDFDEIARLTPDDTYGAAVPARKAAPAKKSTAPPAKKAAPAKAVKPAAAPKPPTLAALRKRVVEARITVPTGAPRAVVENLVDALERGVAPARARELAVRELGELRGMVGAKLADVAAALENGASERAMGFYARQLRRLSEGSGGPGFPARAVPELGKPLQELAAALERGDAAAAKAALPKAVTGSKLKAIGTPGSTVSRSKLGSDLEWVGAGRGDVVHVTHPGYSTVLDGKTVVVKRPAVQAATPEQAAALRRPAKAAKAAKARPAKAAPAKKAAPRVPKVPEPAKMSLPALKTETQTAIERAAAVPRVEVRVPDLAGVPKPVLQQWVQRSRGMTDRQLAQEVGRWRQVVIDRRRDVADLLSQADQLLDAEATAATLGQRGASIVRRWEQAAAGWPDLAEARKVVAAMETGDAAKIRRAIAAAEKKLGLTRTGAGPDLTGAAGLSKDAAVRELQIENRVRQAWTEAEKIPGGWVWLADIRDAVGTGVSREEVDAALRKLARERGVAVAPLDNTKALTPRLRQAGIQIGDSDRHWIAFRDGTETLRPIPGATATALKAGDVARYDRTAMKPIGGKIDDGAHVVVVRPGYRMADGTVLSRPVVEEATAEEAAAAARATRGAKPRMPEPIDRTAAPEQILAQEEAARAAALQAPPVRLPDMPQRSADARTLLHWQRHGDEEANGLLRRGKVGKPSTSDRKYVAPTEEQVRAEIARIDDMMTRSELTEPITVYRGVASLRSVISNPGEPGSLVGRRFREKGFMSTSASREAAASFMAGETTTAAGTMIEIRVPTGTRAITISDVEHKGAANNALSEQEILLDRDLEFRVVSDEMRPYVYRFGQQVRTGDPERHIVVEVVPRKAK